MDRKLDIALLVVSVLQLMVINCQAHVSRHQSSLLDIIDGGRPITGRYEDCQNRGCPRRYECVIERSLSRDIGLEELCLDRFEIGHRRCVCIRGCSYEDYFIPYGESVRVDRCRRCECNEYGQNDCYRTKNCRGRGRRGRRGRRRGRTIRRLVNGIRNIIGR